MYHRWNSPLGQSFSKIFSFSCEILSGRNFHPDLLSLETKLINKKGCCFDIEFQFQVVVVCFKCFRRFFILFIFGKTFFVFFTKLFISRWVESFNFVFIFQSFSFNIVLMFFTQVRGKSFGAYLIIFLFMMEKKWEISPWFFLFLHSYLKAKIYTQNRNHPQNTQLHEADILRFFFPQTHIMFTRARYWYGRHSRKKTVSQICFPVVVDGWG